MSNKNSIIKELNLFINDINKFNLKEDDISEYLSDIKEVRQEIENSLNQIRKIQNEKINERIIKMYKENFIHQLEYLNLNYVYNFNEDTNSITFTCLVNDNLKQVVTPCKVSINLCSKIIDFSPFKINFMSTDVIEYYLNKFKLLGKLIIFFNKLSMKNKQKNLEEAIDLCNEKAKEDLKIFEDSVSQFFFKDFVIQTSL